MTTTSTPDLTGPVFQPGDPGFDQELAAFNLSVRHRPAFAVGAASAHDVSAAVVFAARQGLSVAVQATGHGAVTPVEGGLLINTGRLHGVRVDPQARTARIEAGATWGEVVEAAAEHGLAPLCGSSPGVGAVGYTLGGGLSPIGRTYGFAADHVQSFELVVADGSLLPVDADHHAELFWALRGSRAALGIVTAMTIDLFPVTSLYGGGLYFPGQDAARLLKHYIAWSATLPDTTSTSIALLRIPPLPELPPPLRGQFVVHLRYAHLGTPEEGARLLAPMRATAEPVIDTVRVLPFTQIASVHNDPASPMPLWSQGSSFRTMPDEAIQALLEVAGPGAETPPHVVELRHLGGALAREPRVPNSVSGRDSAYSFLVIGPPAPQGFASLVPALGERVIAAIRPWTAGGSLPNFQTDAPWPPDVDRRLANLRFQYDPDGLFRFGAAL